MQPHGTDYTALSQQPYGAGQPVPVPRPGSLARTLDLIRRVTSTGIVLAAAVILWENLAPPQARPSTLLGSFHGSLDSATLNAQREAQVTTERELAEARAAPPAAYQMETVVNQTQQQVIAGSMGVRSGAAELSDLACFGSMLITGQGIEARQWRERLQAGCGVGTTIRQGMADELARTSRDNSAIAPRAVGAAPVRAPQQAQPVQRQQQGRSEYQISPADLQAFRDKHVPGAPRITQ